LDDHHSTVTDRYSPLDETAALVSAHLHPRSPRRCRRGAERALAHIGLESNHAALDIHELCDLLEAWRDARHTALQTNIRVATTGILALLLLAAAITPKVSGGH